MPTLPSAVTSLGADLPKQGLAETIYTAGGLLRALDFEPGNGRLAHSYNLEGTNPKVGPAPINGTIVQGKFEVTPATVNYQWYGGDVPLDRRIRAMGQPVQDFFALVAEQQAKSMTYYVEDVLINGDNSTDPNQFSGVRKLTTLKIDNGGGPLTKKSTDKAWLKLHTLGRANAIWSANSNVHAQVYEFLGTQAPASEKMADAFGRDALHLHNRPILQNDFHAEEDATGAVSVGGGFTSVFLIGLGGRGLTAKLPPDTDDVFRAMVLPPIVGLPHEYLRLDFGMALALESKFYVVQIYNVQNS